MTALEGLPRADVLEAVEAGADLFTHADTWVHVDCPVCSWQHWRYLADGRVDAGAWCPISGRPFRVTL